MKKTKLALKIFFGILILLVVAALVYIGVVCLVEDNKGNPKQYIGETESCGKYYGEEDGFKRSINWIIIDVADDDNLVLLSEDIIDVVPYQSEEGNTDWENSYAREWLNNDFYEAAFLEADEEVPKDIISYDPFSLNCSLWYSLAQKNKAEKDKVFLMTVDVAKELDSKLLQAEPTSYAEEKGVKPSENGYGMWWLIPPSKENETAAYVDANGNIQYVSYEKAASMDHIGIRPMVIKKYYGPRKPMY